MSNIVWKANISTQLSSTSFETVTGTVSANTVESITWLNVSNTHTSDVMISGQILENGGSPARQIFRDVSLGTSGSGATYTHDGTIYLAEGEVLQVKCNVANVADVRGSVIARG